MCMSVGGGNYFSFLNVKLLKHELKVIDVKYSHNRAPSFEVLDLMVGHCTVSLEAVFPHCPGAQGSSVVVGHCKVLEGESPASLKLTSV